MLAGWLNITYSKVRYSPRLACTHANTQTHAVTDGQRGRRGFRTQELAFKNEKKKNPHNLVFSLKKNMECKITRTQNKDAKRDVTKKTTNK